MSDYALKNASSKEIRKAIKRLNERIADFERKGYTDTALYSELKQFAITTSGGEFRSKSGHIKVQVDVRNIKQAQLRKLSRLSSPYYTLGKELNRVAQRYTGKNYRQVSDESRATLDSIMKVGNDFHNYLQNVDPTIYDIEEDGNIIKGTKRGGNNDGDVSYTEQAKFLQEVENPINWVSDVYKPWKRKDLKAPIKEQTRREYLRVFDFHNMVRSAPLTDEQLKELGL